MTSLLGLFVTPLPYHKSKKSPERKKERSVAVSQACGSTAQVYSVQNTEKIKLTALKDLKSDSCEQDPISKLLDITEYPYI